MLFYGIWTLQRYVIYNLLAGTLHVLRYFDIMDWVDDVNQKCYVFRKIELIQRIMDMDNGYTNDVAIIDWLQFKIDFCIRIANAKHWMSSALNDLYGCVMQTQKSWNLNQIQRIHKSAATKITNYIIYIQCKSMWRPMKRFHLFNQSTFW